MNNRILKILLIPALLIFTSALLSGEPEEVVLDSGFFKDFNSRQIIQRDEYLESITNRIVIGRGIITDIAIKARYKKKYRIVIESSDSGVYNQKFIFYVFLENKDTLDLVNLDTRFEFKGQLMGYTPLSTKRNEYILDVIIIEGSTVIE